MAPICSVDACDKPARSRTAAWCEKHYMRWYRHGDPETTLLMGEPWVATSGYLAAHRPGHPMASDGRSAYLHRVVLFDKIGYGPHLCQWCGTHINWYQRLETDHIDKNRRNNDPSNLVPSCPACNRARSSRKCKPGCQCGRHRRNPA